MFGWADLFNFFGDVAKETVPAVAGAVAPSAFQSLFSPSAPPPQISPSPFVGLSVPESIAQPVLPPPQSPLVSAQPTPAQAPPVASTGPPTLTSPPMPIPPTAGTELRRAVPQYFTGGDTGTPLSRPEGGTPPYASPGIITPSSGFSSLTPSLYRRRLA